MIKFIDGSIFDNLPEYSVLIHQCNAKGWMGAGLAAKIAKKWPNVFKEYHDYCRWFVDGHEDEIMGTFVGVRVNPKFIVCNAIAQKTVSKTKQVTDYDSWHILCKKIEHQTRIVNLRDQVNWTLHIPDKIGCGAGGGDYKEMHNIFEYYFNDSPVQLFFYRY